MTPSYSASPSEELSLQGKNPPPVSSSCELETIEDREWIDSLDHVLREGGADRVRRLLHRLHTHAHQAGVRFAFTANTPYINTISPEEEVPYPGSREIERSIKSLIRWNAMAMVVRANRLEAGIGGHISTYASAATLIEVAFNHFLRAPSDQREGDIVYFQGHASPGIYARAFLEGRLSARQLENFRRELTQPDGGLPSYPHPWLLPNFWQFPTVSMGLSPLMAIYQARFNRYLEDRGLKPKSDAHVWAFLGDGEMDEPEALGAITLASRERLDNLIFIVNCNLQRLDGPVRGNGKIIQELEAAFRGAGWNVIKVIWGSDWDPLLAQDKEGLLVKRMQEIVDGEYQKYHVESGAYIRQHFFGTDPRLLDMVRLLSDEQIQCLRYGGHDPEKVYNAYKAALEHPGAPTVILAQTIKGYGLGESGEGKNISHQQKKLNEEELLHFRSRFGIPLSDEEAAHLPFYKPSETSPEIHYLHERRQALGGYLPERRVKAQPLTLPSEDIYEEFYKGSGDLSASTTMVFVRLLARLLRTPEIGKYIVPIVPDEARTFGMEALFRQCGIYSHVGQLYEPVDRDTLLYYREITDGQILEEGITEAGSLASFIAAGTSYASHGIPMIPFFIFYSMFGLQRVGDLVWAAGDARTRGFLLGATAGRTTLHGEGLQHQDGHSHLLAYPVPTLIAYDPAFAYEVAVIIQDGLHRMFHEQENVFYYLTLGNESYAMPAMPQGVREGILKGLYRLKASEAGEHHPKKKSGGRVHLLGSGSILNEAIKAQGLLEDRYGISADVWSVTSYKELYREALQTERWNRLHPGKTPRVPYVTRCFQEDPGVFIAASDFVKALPTSLAQWLPGPLTALGTDGFGRSDNRQALRNFFEVDERFITLAALYALAREKKITMEQVQKAIKDLEVNPEKADPMIS